MNDIFILSFSHSCASLFSSRSHHAFLAVIVAWLSISLRCYSPQIVGLDFHPHCCRMLALLSFPLESSSSLLSCRSRHNLILARNKHKGSFSWLAQVVPPGVIIFFVVLSFSSQCHSRKKHKSSFLTCSGRSPWCHRLLSCRVDLVTMSVAQRTHEQCLCMHSATLRVQSKALRVHITTLSWDRQRHTLRKDACPIQALGDISRFCTKFITGTILARWTQEHAPGDVLGKTTQAGRFKDNQRIHTIWHLLSFLRSVVIIFRLSFSRYKQIYIERERQRDSERERERNQPYIDNISIFLILALLASSLHCFSRRVGIPTL